MRLFTAFLTTLKVGQMDVLWDHGTGWTFSGISGQPSGDFRNIGDKYQFVIVHKTNKLGRSSLIYIESTDGYSYGPGVQCPRLSLNISLLSPYSEVA